MYDAANQQLRQVNPLGRIVTTLYDAAGRNTRRIDARGNRTTFSYDGADRLVGKRYQDGSRVTISYDGAGHRKLLNDATGRHTWTYDKVYRVATEAIPTVGKLTFTYDKAGQRTKLTDSLGQKTTYTFDNAGRLTKLKNAHGETTTFVYDNGNRRLSTKLANGTQATFAYDKAGRTLVVANKKSDASTISRFTSTYDKAGNRKTVKEATGDRVTYSYDATYQLLGERRSGAHAFRHTFTYDKVGNRQTWNIGTDSTAYAYDEANELLTGTDAAGTTTYTYDLDGNQHTVETPANDLTTHTWDFENRLIRVELPTTDLVTHIYNGDHQRVANVDAASVATTYVWDGNNVLTDLDDTGSPVAEYTLEPVEFGNLVSLRDDLGDSHWYHFDAIGSMRELTDSSEVVTDDALYSAFGKTEASTGTTDNQFGWLAQPEVRTDPDTGEKDARRNWYLELIGRMLSQDQKGIRTSTPNLYVYADNNPATLSDPSGLEPFFTATDQEAAIRRDVLKKYGFAEREFKALNPTYWQKREIEREIEKRISARRKYDQTLREAAERQLQEQSQSPDPEELRPSALKDRRYDSVVEASLRAKGRKPIRLLDAISDGRLDPPEIFSIKLTRVEIVSILGDKLRRNLTPMEMEAAELRYSELSPAEAYQRQLAEINFNRARLRLYLHETELREAVTGLYRVLRGFNPSHFIAETVVVIATGHEPVLNEPRRRDDALLDLLLYLVILKGTKWGLTKVKGHYFGPSASPAPAGAPQVLEFANGGCLEIYPGWKANTGPAEAEAAFEAAAAGKKVSLGNPQGPAPKIEPPAGPKTETPLKEEPLVEPPPQGVAELDNNILSALINPNDSNHIAAVAFANANKAAGLHVNRSAYREFLQSYSKHQFDILRQQYGIKLIRDIPLEELQATAMRLQNAFTDGRVLHEPDARVAASAYIRGERLATNDLPFFRRAKDLGLQVEYVGSGPSAAKAAAYVPMPVTIPPP